MANEITVWAVRITTKVSLDTDATIGLYQVPGSNSELRWSPRELSGVAEVWGTGFLAEDWCDDIVNRADTRRGGTRAIIDDHRIKVSNHAQLQTRLQDKGIFLGGCKYEVLEFVGTEYNNDSVSRSVIYTGTIKTADFDAYYGDIVATDIIQSRKANISTEITETNYPSAEKNLGKSVPITFGSWLTNRAKFISVADKTSLLEMAQWNTLNDTAGSVVKFEIRSNRIYGHSTFKISEYSGGTYRNKYKFELCSNEYGSVWTNDGVIAYGWRWYVNDGRVLYGIPKQLNYFINKWVRCIEGAGQGTYRKITDAWMVSFASNKVEITISTPLETEFDTTSVIEIVDEDFQYASENWPCKGFYDSNGLELSSGAQVSVYDSEAGFNTIAPYSVDVDTSTTDKNVLTLDPEFVDSDPGSPQSFLVLPVLVEKMQLGVRKPGDLYYWGYGSDYIKYSEDGIYYNTAQSSAYPLSISDVPNSYDKNLSTYMSMGGEIKLDNYHLTPNYLFAFDIILPELPEDFELNSSSKVYLGFRFSGSYNIAIGEGSFYFATKVRRWFEIANGIYESQLIGQGKVHNNIPNFYISGSSLNNLDFFQDGDVTRLTKYDAIDLSDYIKDSRSYGEYRIGVFFGRYGVGVNPTITEDIKVNELCLMIKQEDSLKNDVYPIGFKGRIFNDTWGTRKTATDLIEKPQDVIEHALRLQNYGSNASPGKAYDSTASIKTSGAGSFDDSSLSPLAGEEAPVETFTPGNIPFRRQIFDKSQAYTDDLVRSACEESYLVQFVNNDGYECVDYLFREGSSAGTITLDQLLEPVRLIQPKIDDIYCQPDVRYNYDPASGDYKGRISIGNVDKDSYNQSYVQGVGPYYGPILWNLCHLLFQKYGQIEVPAKGSLDLNWIYTFNGAFWWLYKYLIWCDKWRTTLTLPYDVAKYWQIGTCFELNLPHETNGIDITCKVEGIARNATQNRCTVYTVLLDDITPGALPDLKNFKDTNRLQPIQVFNWADSNSTYAERGNTGLADSQDTNTIQT